MEHIKQQISAIRSAKTIPDLFRSISAGTLENLAMVPLLLFILVPFLQVMINFFVFYQLSFMIEDATRIGTGAAVLAMVIALGKACTERSAVKPLLQRNAPMFWLGVFVLLMLISPCVNGFTAYALQGGDRQESLFSYISYIVLYFYSGSLVQSPKKKAILLYTMLGVSLFLSICALVHLYIAPIEQLGFYQERHLRMIYGHFNHYGYYLVFAVLVSGALFTLEKNRAVKAVALVSFLLNNVVLVLNDTFGAYLACIVGLVFQGIVLFIIRRRIDKPTLVLLALMLAVSAVMGFWVDNVFRNFYKLFIDFGNIAKAEEEACSAGSGRWTLWQYTLRYIGEQPIFGFGVEGITERLREETGGICDRSHNEVMQYAAFFGIPAAIAYVIGVFRVYWNGLKLKAQLDSYTIASLVMAFGYLASSFVGNTTYYLTPFFFIFLGLGFVRDKGEGQCREIFPSSTK